jgi:hypothetical protein
MKSKLMLVVLSAASAMGQSRARDLAAVLQTPLETPDVVGFQLRQYMYQRIPKINTPATAAQWTAEADKMRKHLLDDVVFHGWPRAWVDAPPRFEDLGIIESGKGYRVHKLRYEIVPGFQSTAILYEPENLTGKVPASSTPTGTNWNWARLPNTNKNAALTSPVEASWH